MKYFHKFSSNQISNEESLVILVLHMRNASFSTNLIVQDLLIFDVYIYGNQTRTQKRNITNADRDYLKRPLWSSG